MIMWNNQTVCCCKTNMVNLYSKGKEEEEEEETQVVSKKYTVAY